MFPQIPLELTQTIAKFWLFGCSYFLLLTGLQSLEGLKVFHYISNWNSFQSNCKVLLSWILRISHILCCILGLMVDIISLCWLWVLLSRRHGARIRIQLRLLLLLGLAVSLVTTRLVESNSLLRGLGWILRLADVATRCLVANWVAVWRILDTRLVKLRAGYLADRCRHRCALIRCVGVLPRIIYCLIPRLIEILLWVCLLGRVLARLLCWGPDGGAAWISRCIRALLLWVLITGCLLRWVRRLWRHIRCCRLIGWGRGQRGWLRLLPYKQDQNQCNQNQCNQNQNPLIDISQQ